MKNGLLFLMFCITCLVCCDVSQSGSAEKFEFEVLDYFQVEDLSDKFYTSRSDTLASLGRVLFHDKRLSKNNTISCETCHVQSKAFCDNEQFSMGLENGLTTRNSMSLINSMYQRRFFWEGIRSTSVGSIPVLMPVSNHIEMGMDSSDELVEKLNGIELYESLFDEIYEGNLSESTISEALRLYLQSIISKDSKYDKVLRNESALSYQESAGLELFNGKALCGECHKGDHFISTWRNTANIGLDLNYADQGAGDGLFKVPSLRNIALTGPYMHDGRFETLEEVVDHYVNGIKDHPNLDWTLDNIDIDLSKDEQEQLVAFLHTLTDYKVLTDQRYSNPF